MVEDWARWPGDSTYGWSRPANELLFLKDVDRFCPGEVRGRIDQEVCNWDVLDELFIALIKLAYDWVCDVLSSVVDVEKLTDFEFDLEDPSAGDFAEDSALLRVSSLKRIVGWSIYNVEARRRELESGWLDDFHKTYGVSLQHFIELYNHRAPPNQTGMFYDRTKHVAAELQKEGIRISRAEVERILHRFREHHSHIARQLEH